MSKKARNLPFSLSYFRKQGQLELLAYETGVHLGDGRMGEKRYACENWRINRYIQYTGDLVNEKYYYEYVLQPLLVKLYNIKLLLHSKERDHTCTLFTRQKDVFEFKKRLQLPIGKKINIQIPPFIKDTLQKDFLRGFADTDFGLTFKNRKKTGRSYPVITFKTSDQQLVIRFAKILRQLGFDVNTYFNLKNIHKKSPVGYYIDHSLEINGRQNLEKWIKIIGFWSPKHLSKYLLWKATGSCPISTTTEHRCKVLKDLGIELKHYLPL